jgi:hypothetical protein
MAGKIDKNRAAATFDVRGSILMHKYEYKDNIQISPKVRLVVTKHKYPVLYWLKENFGGCVSDAADDRKYWQVSSNKAIKFLEQIAPLLKNKKRKKQAEWLLKYWPDKHTRDIQNKKKLLKRFRALK